MSRTAVVILNYNGAKLLQKFLPSVIEFSPDSEIIVADNNSSDASIEFVQHHFPTVRIIKLDNNYGFCGGYNRALSQVEADYFVLLNSDIEVTMNWLLPMKELMEENRHIAAVQPKVLAYNNRNKFEHAGAAGGFIDALGYPFCRGRVFDYVEDDKGQYDDTREIFWATGACLMIHAETFRKFGGLDEDFFAHMEEIDLAWKFHRAGHKIFYCGRSTVYHVGAGTLNYRNPKKIFLNFRNGLSLLLKHLDTSELFYKLPIRIALDWIAAIQFLLKGELGSFFAVFRAHGNFLTGLQRNTIKRNAIRRTYPSYDRTMIYHGSIVFDYYIRGKKSGYAPPSFYEAKQPVQ